MKKMMVMVFAFVMVAMMATATMAAEDTTEQKKGLFTTIGEKMDHAVNVAGSAVKTAGSAVAETAGNIGSGIAKGASTVGNVIGNGVNTVRKATGTGVTKAGIGIMRFGHWIKK